MSLQNLVRASAVALCLSTLVSAGSSAGSPAGEAQWFADFDLAQKEAQKTGKDLLVDFTGSDWCGWCIRLHEEVFGHEAFETGVKNDFVLVALDFPQGDEVKAKVPNPGRNQELSELHAIDSFPTILLMTAQGEVYARTGYREGGPEGYVTHLGELRTGGKAALAQLSEKLAAFAQAGAAEKPAAWDALADLAKSLDAESPFATRLAEPLKQAFELDPENAQGRKLRALELLFQLGRVDAAVREQVRAFDPKNERGLLERTVSSLFERVQDDKAARAAIEALTQFEASAKFQDQARAVELYSMAAIWLARPLQDPEAAKPWARKALALEIKDDQMRAMLEELVAE